MKPLLSLILVLSCAVAVQADEPLSDFEALQVALKRSGGSLSKTQCSIREGEIPSVALLKHLEKVEKLDFLFISNERPEKVLENLPSLPQIKQLVIVNDISDTGMAHIATMTSLVHLHVQGPKITDRGLKHLESLKKLESLKLNNTRVTKAGVDKLYEKLPKVVAEVSR